MNYMNLLKRYSDANPEKYNKEFILSKTDDAILPELTSIFKSLECIDEIHILDVSMNRNEETFGPIKQQGKYYKSLLESRLIKIHYKIKIDGADQLIEKDMFLPKLLNNCFYINEGNRYFPILQVVDNLGYATNNGYSLKSLMMPVTLIKNDPFDVYPEFGAPVVEKVPNYYTLLFTRKISPLYYIMMQYSLTSLEKAGISPFEDLSKYQTYSDKTLIDSFKEYIGLDIKFDNDPLNLVEDGRTVFKLSEKKDVGLSFSMKNEDLATERGKVCLGLLLSTRCKERKSKLIFTVEQFTTPWYWLDKLIEVSSFSKSSDPFKRLDKIKSVYISLQRIIDDQARATLPIAASDKQDSSLLSTINS